MFQQIIWGVSLICAASTIPVGAWSMMGGDMMGSSMPPVMNRRASENVGRPLADYIRNQNLSCFSCHAVSGSDMGPSFVEISHRYEGNPKAEAILTRSVIHGVSGKWPGYGAMPGGLASPKQAQKVASLIIRLSKTKTP